MNITQNLQTVVCFSYFYASKNLSAFLRLHFCLSFQFLIQFEVSRFSFRLFYFFWPWLAYNPEANILGGGKFFTSSLNICLEAAAEWGGGGQSNTPPPHHHPISQLIHGYFI